MEDLEELLAQSAALHGGRPCPGQVLGVRMTMAGCRKVGLEEPKKTKQLVVYVEIDRCAADAIQAVTGCKLGKRTLKHVDYGKMAATFVNTATGRAARVAARATARQNARRYAPEAADGHAAQLQAYRIMPDAELLAITPVSVAIAPNDLPGPSSKPGHVQGVRGGHQRRPGGTTPGPGPLPRVRRVTVLPERNDDHWIVMRKCLRTGSATQRPSVRAIGRKAWSPLSSQPTTKGKTWSPL